MVDKKSQISTETETASSSSDTEIPIGEDYKLYATKKLGSGAFGEIYQGLSLKLNEEVAIKLEMAKNNKHPQLLYESKLYSALQGGVGIPTVYWYGSQGNYNILIMDLLGPSLEDLFNLMKRKYSVKTTLMLGEQIISRVEFIHNRGFIHRDIKPDNFLIGSGKKKQQVFAIDFGLAKRFKDPKTGLHIPYKDGKSLTGTARYASINTHLGIEQARRDDIESLVLVMIYFLKGELPWQGLKARNVKEKYLKIKEKKINTKVEDLCEGMPKQLITLLNYARDLKFEDKPDYAYLKKTIQFMAANEKIEFDYNFDWMEKRSTNKVNENQAKTKNDTSNIPNESTKQSSPYKKR
mmetsp:Transcript_225/g.205  ORF Transcript_225/g.205 Transcript_225/m.205 type:complete len:351 (+) Transcript_225:24-1076(+)